MKLIMSVVTTGAKDNYDSKNEDVAVDKSGTSSDFVALWEKCHGETLKLLHEAMNGVKDEFWKEAAKEGFNPQNKEFRPTNDGICLLQIGYQQFIGLVELTPPDLIGIIGTPAYYASIRVSHVVGTLPIMPFRLEGFIISQYNKLDFVDIGQRIVFGGEHLLKTGWQSCANEGTIKLLKNAMNGVKDDFFRIAKQRGFDVLNKEYHPTDHGICKLLKGGQHFIGLVQLSKPGTIGGYYASIRVSQIVGTLEPMPYQLRGFIITIYPWLRFVQDGVFAFGNGIIVVGDNDDNKNNNNNNNKNNKKIVKSVKIQQPKANLKVNAKQLGTQMYYVPVGGTSQVSQNIDYLKDSILKAVGLTPDAIDTFEIASAALCRPLWVCV